MESCSRANSRGSRNLFDVTQAALTIAGGAYGIVSATAGTSSSTTAATSPAPPSGRPALGGKGSNARSGPASGGVVGTVASVSGSSFTLATSAGQRVSYPGGIVDRVVELSSGEYEVHNIGVNWSHHIFVDKKGTVIGAS